MPAPETDNADYWETRYRERRGQWSGKPNALLVDAIADLHPGTALDLGCGEGGDAIWLAAQGWTVTAVDVAQTALAFGAEQAAAAGVGAAISWERHDLAESFPTGAFDLVSSCYLQSPIDMPRAEMLRASAGGVAPGGTLLIIGHTGRPHGPQGHDHPDMPTPGEVLASLALPPEAWQVVRSEVVDRHVTRPDGSTGTHQDGILRVTRLA